MQFNAFGEPVHTHKTQTLTPQELRKARLDYFEHKLKHGGGKKKNTTEKAKRKATAKGKIKAK